MFSWALRWLFTEKQIASLVRGGMKYVGGFLTAWGATQPQVDNLSTVVVGIALAISGQVISAIAKLWSAKD